MKGFTKPAKPHLSKVHIVDSFGNNHRWYWFVKNSWQLPHKPNFATRAMWSDAFLWARARNEEIEFGMQTPVK